MWSISIFQNNLIDKLLPGEMVEADKGYSGEKEKVRTPDDWTTREERNKKRLARARQETANKRIKVFGILRGKY